MTVMHPMEVELKLALPPQQVVTFLKMMTRRRSEPLQQNLLTRYFDTPDFALSAKGVALRVRRVGRRWLQTLKTEGERCGGLSQRVEYEMPISRGAPDWSRFPPAALDWVPEAFRTQLVPVFETRFKRSAWLIKGQAGAQIEVALDVGEVIAGKRSQPICEIELELKSGQPDALFELAQGWASRLDCVPFDISKAERGVNLAHDRPAEPVKAAPVKSAPLDLHQAMMVEDGFATMVQACLTQFQANLPGVLASDDIEYVHQARVALRRLRAVLRVYRRVCVLPGELLAGLRTLAAALGSARDWDVLCSETLPPMAPWFSDPDGWQQGMDRLEAHRAEVRAGMRAAVQQARPGAWLLACQRWLWLRSWQDVPEAQRLIQLSVLKKWARKALQKGHRVIVRGAGELEPLQPAQRHALRIAIKRQRYAAECFQPLFSGRKAARYLAELQWAQDSLGRCNDAQVARGLLSQVQLHTGAMGQFALGWLAARQAENTEDEIAQHLQNFMKLGPCW